MASDDDEVDGGWGDPENESARGAPSAAHPTPEFGVPVVRRPLASTPAFGVLAPPPILPDARTPAFGTPAVAARERNKTPAGGLEAPRRLPQSAAARPIAAPRADDARSPDRATMPPPMPEQEYIERVLSMDEGDAPAPRRRMNTLVEHDPLQYDAPAADENTRPTKPPEPPPPTARPAHGQPDAGEEFLDLELDLGDGRISSPDVLPPPGPVLPRRALFPAGPPVPLTEPPPTVRADALDDLPIDEVLESIPPRAYSVRPAQAATASPPGARPLAPESSKVRPSPATLRNAGERPRPERASSEEVSPQASTSPQPTPPANVYDSSPAIEVLGEDDADAVDLPPARALARPEVSARPPASARPPVKTPAAGTAILPEARRTPPPSSEAPTRELRRQAKSAESPLDRIVERIQAGDFGRALMLADQTLAGGDASEDIQHYAELCREKLRQTYLERIGSGRTILRVAVDPDALRSRTLDPRLAFLLSLLDGASTIDDVVDMSTMPPLEAVRALHELLQEGVVEVVQPGRRRQAP